MNPYGQEKSEPWFMKTGLSPNFASHPSGSAKMEAIDLQMRADMEEAKARAVAVTQSVVVANNASCQPKSWLSIATNPFFVALIGGLTVALVLLALQPPFVLKKSDNPLYKASVDPLRIGVISILSAVFIYAVPAFMCRSKAQTPK